MRCPGTSCAPKSNVHALPGDRCAWHMYRSHKARRTVDPNMQGSDFQNSLRVLHGLFAGPSLMHHDPAAVGVMQSIKPCQHAEVPIEFLVVVICQPKPHRRKIENVSRSMGIPKEHPKASQQELNAHSRPAVRQEMSKATDMRGVGCTNGVGY